MKNYTDEDVVRLNELHEEQLKIWDGRDMPPIDLREVLAVGQRIRWAALKEELPGLLKAIPENSQECVIAKMVNCGAYFEVHHPHGYYREARDLLYWTIVLPETEDGYRYATAIFEDLAPDYPEVKIVDTVGHGPRKIIAPICLARLAAYYDDWPEELAFLVEDGLLERRRAEQD